MDFDLYQNVIGRRLWKISLTFFFFCLFLFALIEMIVSFYVSSESKFVFCLYFIFGVWISLFIFLFILRNIHGNLDFLCLALLILIG